MHSLMRAGLLVLLALCAFGASALAAGDQFAEEFRICPPELRLAALSGVQVRIGARDQLIVDWDQPNPELWGLPGDTAVVTVLANGPQSHMQQSELESPRAVFDNMDYTNHVWIFKVAVTDRDTVISDIVTREFPYGDKTSDRTEKRVAAPARVPVTVPPVPDGAIIVSFMSIYSATEGDTVNVSVQLSADPQETVTLPLSARHAGGASTADYTVPADVVFNSGETQTSFSVQLTDDSEDDDGESVILSFGTLPDGIVLGSPSTATIRIVDNDVPDVVANFGASTYSVTEGSTVSVQVRLSANPERTVILPLSTTLQGGASTSDYSGVPTSVTFNSGQTSKTFTFQATDDNENDVGESVDLAFGALPAGVSEGTTNSTTVSITDNDEPPVVIQSAGRSSSPVEAQFGVSAYSVKEGATVTVSVHLSIDPTGTVTVPLSVTHRGGAAADDYSGIPASVTFNQGESIKDFTVQAIDDNTRESLESVVLGFGTLPSGIAVGSTSTATVTVSDRTYTAGTGNVSASIKYEQDGSPTLVRRVALTHPVITIISNEQIYYIVLTSGTTLRYEARWNPRDKTETIRPAYSMTGGMTITSITECQTDSTKVHKVTNGSVSGSAPSFLASAPQGSAGGTWDIYVIVEWGKAATGLCHTAAPTVPNKDVTVDPIVKRVHRIDPED